MDWLGVKADIERGTIANWKHLPTSEIEEVACLALAGKALAEAVRCADEAETAYTESQFSKVPADVAKAWAGFEDARAMRDDALAEWDAIDREGEPCR